MKSIISTALTVFLIATGQNALAEEEDMRQKPERRIELVPQEQPFVFGRESVFDVYYVNDSEEPWELPHTPNESRRTRFRRAPAGKDGKPIEGKAVGGYPFAIGESHKVTEEVNGVEYTWFYESRPPAEPMTVAPNDRYHFTCELDPSLSRVRPGAYAVSIRDSRLELESERVAVRLYFTEESVENCLEIARDEDNTIIKRWYMAGHFLVRIMPEIEPLFRRGERYSRFAASHIFADMSKEERQEALDRIEEYWQDEENAPAIREAIENINRDAGLPPLPEIEDDPDPKE